MHHRPVLVGAAMLGGALAAGAVSGYLLVTGILTTFDRPLTAWYLRNNH